MCDRADLRPAVVCVCVCVCHAGKCNFTSTLVSGVKGSHSSSDSMNNTSQHSIITHINTHVCLALWMEDRSPCVSE